MIPSMNAASICAPTSQPLTPAKSDATKRKRALLLTLTAVQFVHVLDFVIVMPLGPQLMTDLGVGTTTFGLFVSSYNVAAALAGIGGAVLLDRFDRRAALVSVFFGLGLATFACAWAFDATTLLGARFLAGIFGGLIQAILFTIVGDCFAERERGVATGTVMSAFSVASVVGVPIGLFIAGRWGWRAPFACLAFVSLFVGIAAHHFLPPLTSHLKKPKKSVAPRGEWHELKKLVSRPRTIDALLLIVSLMFAGYTVIPYISAYLVSNLGLTQADLASVFLAGGIATFATARQVGKLSDRFGKLSVFTWLAIGSVIPILLLTHLPQVPVLLALFVTAFFTLSISARGIPALAMITASIEKSRRGRFLSLTSSVQQIASGAASLFAGWILHRGLDGRLDHFDTAGLVAASFTLLSVYFAHRLRNA
jgi:predicted MFS family arabinose efflux permease